MSQLETSGEGAPPPRFYALIPCAGIGARAGGDGPKQYQDLLGQPLVMHTLAAFAAVSRLTEVWVVVAPSDDFFDGPAARQFQVCRCGGASRADSVRNGLAHLQEVGARDNDWVLVHDAARCLITPAQINGLIDACHADPVGGLLALPLADTLKVAQDGRAVATLARADKWLAQTPQMFPLGLLLRALREGDATVTDEASAIEALGLTPKLVPASAQNFKVTFPDDFSLAAAVLRGRTT